MVGSKIDFAIVWRNLTIEEWQNFMGSDIPYEATCPNLMKI